MNLDEFDAPFGGDRGSDERTRTREWEGAARPCATDSCSVRPGRAHGARQLQPALIDIRDHDVSCANMFGDRGGHDPNGARARDQDVLTNEIKRQRGVRCVPKGIKYGGGSVADRVNEPERVHSGELQIFGEASVSMNTDPNRITTEMALSCSAVPAMTTGYVPLT